ncbi:hypothetical protein B5F35_01585 [Anaeromassilibacillus sp. An200]|nr:hypothetical protein B5F35_01585 [Anaeromassilibacillus sp. An200]
MFFLFPFPAQAAEAPHFLPPRNGGKNREGLCPFEPLWSPTRALRPLSLGAAGLRRKAAKRRLATEQLAIFDCETVLVRWGTALHGIADSTQPLKRNFPGEARKIMLQTADRR